MSRPAIPPPSAKRSSIASVPTGHFKIGHTGHYHIGVTAIFLKNSAFFLILQKRFVAAAVFRDVVHYWNMTAKAIAGSQTGMVWYRLH